MTQPPNSESKNDEITNLTRRFRQLFPNYFNTIRLVYLAPRRLQFVGKESSTDKGSLPPIKFFATSLILITIVVEFLYPGGLVDNFEWPQIIVRLKAAFAILSLSLPFLSLLNLLFVAILPWLILRVFTPNISFKKLFYIYCYHQGGIVIPFYAVVMLFVILAYSVSPIKGASFQSAVDFVLVGVSIYSLIWLSKLFPEACDQKTFTIVFALLVSMATIATVNIYYMPMESYNTPSGSMRPTLEPGERFIVNKWAYKSRTPNRGEIIVYYPDEIYAQRKIPYVARIVGIPGDKIVYFFKDLYINETKVTQEATNLENKNMEPIKIHKEKLGTSEYQIITTTALRSDSFDMTVPEGHYFVLGDNRDRSNDSRRDGPIPLDRILGHAYYRFLPLERKGEL